MSFIEANNITLWMQREGDANKQAIVFVNSLGSDYRIWDEMMPDFADYSCIRYDKRGHGLSDCPSAPYSISDHADDLASLLTKFSISDVILIGISVGGMIAMDYTAKNPDKVKALILLDTFPKIGTSAMWNERISTLRQSGMAHLGDAILARWFAPSYQENHPADYRGYYNMLTRMPVGGYTCTCQAIRDADLTEAARTIACPTLVLCGAEDQSTPPELVRGITDIIPDSRYVEIENAGHLPCVENPNATASAINSFLKEVL